MRGSFASKTRALIVIASSILFQFQSAAYGQNGYREFKNAVDTLRNSKKEKEDFETLINSHMQIVFTHDVKVLREISQNYDTTDPFELFCSFAVTVPFPMFTYSNAQHGKDIGEEMAKNVCLRIASDRKFREYYLHFVKWMDIQHVLTDDRTGNKEHYESRRFTRLSTIVNFGFCREKCAGPWDHRLQLSIYADLFGQDDWVDKLLNFEKSDEWGRELTEYILESQFEANEFSFSKIRSSPIAKPYLVEDLHRLKKLPYLKIPTSPFPVKDELIDLYIRHVPILEKYLGRHE